MQMKTNFLVALAAMVVAPALFTGCGGPECGTGTTEQDGMCVPTAAPVTCDEDTELSDGKCVSTVEEISCAAGTELANGECVLAAGGCGEGTSLMDGTCVADDPDLSLACAAGTSFDSAAGACVADFTVVCGANTVEQNGSCVPDAASLCATGTMPDADGVCVIAAAACGENTILDPNSNTCLVNDANAFCGANTAYDADSATCVPTSSVCDAGTTFDDMTGLCLPDVTCQAGDVILDGVCVSPARDAFANADLASTETADRTANNDDPETGGTTIPLTLPAIGTEYRVAGTINAPLDLDADNALDQDVDTYSFTATAGQTFKVAVQPVAGPPVAFVVQDESGNYIRYSTLGLAPGAARQILIPRAGTYTVSVTSAVALTDDVAPIGDDSWDYVLSMEEIAGPMATDVDTSLNDVTGEFANLNDNLYKLTNFTGGEIVEFTVDSVGDNVESAVMQVWASPTQFVSSYELSPGAAFTIALPSPDAFIFFDWVSVNGPNTSFSVGAEALSNQESLGLIPAGSGELTSTPLDQVLDDVRYITFSLAPGEVAEVSQTNAEDGTVELTVTGPDGAEVFNELTFNASTASTPEYGYIYSPNGGSYVIQSTAKGTRTGGTINVRSLTPNVSGPYTTGDSFTLNDPTPLTYKEQTFQRFSVTADSYLSLSLLGNGGETTGDIDIIDAVTGEKLSTITSNTESLLFSLTAGDYLFGIEADASAGFATGYTLSGDLLDVPAPEIEPNDDLASATPVTIPGFYSGTGGYSNGGTTTEWDAPGGPGTNAPFDYFKFTLAQDLATGESIDVDLLNAALTEPSGALGFSVFDSAGNLLQTNDVGNTISLNNLTAGDYFVGIDVSFDTSFDTTYALRIEQVIPPQQPLGQLTAAGVSTMPTSLASGETLAITFDVDAGDFFEFIQDNDQAGSISLSLSEGTTDSTFAAQSSTSAERAYGYAATQGSYAGIVKANSNLTNAVFTARSITPTNLNTKVAGDVITLTSAVAVPREAREFYSVTFADNVNLTGSITSDASNNADLHIINPANGEIVRSITSGKSSIDILLPPGTYIMVVEADGSQLATGYTVSLDVIATPYTVLDGSVGDTCSDAIPVMMSGTYQYTGDMASFSADHTPPANNCLGSFQANGRDVVFAVTLDDGQSLTASLDGSADFSIWLASDCAMIGSTCVAGEDGGNPEEIIDFIHTGATTTYYLVADRYTSATSAQPFTLDITIQ